MSSGSLEIAWAVWDIGYNFTSVNGKECFRVFTAANCTRGEAQGKFRAWLNSPRRKFLLSAMSSTSIYTRRRTYNGWEHEPSLMSWEGEPFNWRDNE